MGPKMLPIEMSSPHSYSTIIHTICLSCTAWPQYTTRQIYRRQTERSEQAAYAIAKKYPYVPTWPGHCVVYRPSVLGSYSGLPGFQSRSALTSSRDILEQALHSYMLKSVYLSPYSTTARCINYRLFCLWVTRTSIVSVPGKLYL